MANYRQSHSTSVCVYSESSDQLKELALFIVRVYAPMWFAIKMKPSCKDGGRHVFGTINKSRYMKKDLHRVVDPVIQRNGYFGHPENLLLSMITDARPHIRELGVRRIMKARKEARPGTVRVFKLKIFKLNVLAKFCCCNFSISCQHVV